MRKRSANNSWAQDQTVTLDPTGFNLAHFPCLHYSFFSCMPHAASCSFRLFAHPICHGGTTDSLPLSSQLKSIIGQTRVLRSDILWDTKLERIRSKANRKMIKQKKIIVPLVLLGGSICKHRSRRHRVSYGASNNSGWIREMVCNQNCRGNPIITVNFTLEHQTMPSCANTYKLN